MKSISLAMFLVFTVAACSTTTTADLNVRTTFDENTDFSIWKTYRFSTASPPNDGTQRYPRLDDQIRVGIEENLSDRGYVRIEDGVPDFRIASGFSSRGDQGSDPVRPMRLRGNPHPHNHANAVGSGKIRP